MHVQVHRARLARLAGQPDDALRRYAESREAAGDQSAGALAAEWLEGVGATLATGSPIEDGALLLGAADALRTALGAPVPPHERPGHDRDVAARRNRFCTSSETDLPATSSAFHACQQNSHENK